MGEAGGSNVVCITDRSTEEKAGKQVEEMLGDPG